MNVIDYRESRKIVGAGFAFYALIMAAMQQADTENLERLRLAFPDVWAALQKARA